jgi:DNA invertase Pin-like site-specific DNA recombinase
LASRPPSSSAPLARAVSGGTVEAGFLAKLGLRFVERCGVAVSHVGLIATLMDSGVEFIAVDNPHANKLTIHILAAVAQHEREMISARTSAALKAARARGKRLGNPKLSEARRHAAAARKERAERYSANVLPVIREIQASGIKSLRGVARALAARGIPTARGGAWSPVQVSTILQRAK